jgi:phage baseplate assembly protein gpV
VNCQDKRHVTFADGTWLEYDRAEHKLTANVQGDIDITATGNVTVTASGDITIAAGGNVKITGAKIDLN